ncbi:DUF3857 domain-containing protein [Chryseobacterium koreense]|uniref:DUF3857 domain-containing protein n=1 Tax=Chryseobacterium koreense TaxID=232216 RepID=UPI0026F2DAF4|nr:DUF3857 domain-containing protein [Chryseobacterium koreense]
MNKLSRLLLLLLPFAIFSQDLNVANIPENLKENAKAVIRENREDYVLKSIDNLTIKSSRSTTIMNEGGDDFAYVVIHYNPTTRVSDIKVEILDAQGKTIKSFSKRDFTDVSNGSNSPLYVDDRVLYLKPVSTKYPYTVKYSYETNTSNTVYISRFAPYNSFDIALQKSEMNLTNNSGINVRTKITETPLAILKISQNGNTSTYSYENVPALRAEELAPTIDYLVPRIEFSPEKFTLEGKQGDLSDWNSFGKWYYHQLINPVSKITPEISAEISALNLQGSTADKVKTIYRYMQDKTRYVLISMGIGGWQPMPASEVSKKGYGDCKALTNYMRTLLNAAGIPSYYAVIYSDDSVRSFDRDFPKLSGNHVVLMVPTEDGEIWLENTSQKVAFNHLTYSSYNRNVLGVNENGIKIIDTPVYRPEQSKEKLTAKIILKEDGGFNSQANMEFTGGQYDQNLRLFSLKNYEVQEVMKNRHYHLKFSSLKIENLKNDKDYGAITYDLNMEVNGFSKKIGNDLFFQAVPFYEATMFSATEERKLPLEISFPFQDDYAIEFEIPAGYKLSEIPKSSELSSEFGSYSIHFDLKDNKLMVRRILTIKKGNYPKEKYKEYVAFRKKTAGNDNAKVLITKL